MMTAKPKCPHCGSNLFPDYSDIDEQFLWLCHECSRAYYNNEVAV